MALTVMAVTYGGTAPQTKIEHVLCAISKLSLFPISKLSLFTKNNLGILKQIVKNGITGLAG